MWKDYFLDRAQKLAPKIFRPPAAGAAGARPGNGGPASMASREPPSSRGPVRSRLSAHRSVQEQRRGHEPDNFPPSSPLPEHERATSVRSRRGGPVDEFHAGTLIPRVEVSNRPVPPSPPEVDGRRFTDEDRIFFIHFLRWQLREGPVPEREELYDALAEQTPHHNADAWRRHWDDAPELPDKIYIEARKRADREGLVWNSPSSSASTDEEDGDEGMKDASAVPSASQRSSKTLAVLRLRKISRGSRVTEDDFLRMARYMYEKREVWGQYSSANARWEEFAKRPENGKRTLPGWVGVERDRNRGKDIAVRLHRYTADLPDFIDLQSYYVEYVETVAGKHKDDYEADSELEYADEVTRPQNQSDGASTTSRSRSVKEELLDRLIPQKRSVDSDITGTMSASGALLPVKRIKDDVDPEVIEIDSD
ncbi:hypothetical protein BD310DRAFT_460838 [Dichomitus squalens]|uniref:Uncharacterized protein n=1 Tax=Dichomitus squalens TaxID=114155 RepID=A0A4Q9Q9T3_9APHY|nr:hypothetical protein BD310DRAFT_460838 [Dichomitus squalens]